MSRVVLASAVPGDEPNIRIEPERALTIGEPDTVVGPGSAGYPVGVGRVDLDFFDAFEIPILMGRGFADGDLSAGATAVIVNQSFVKRVLAGESPLGRRVRRVARRDGNASAETVPPGPWYEIVGVVPDFPHPVVDSTNLQPTLYQPMIPTAFGSSKRTVVRRFLEEMDTGGASEERAPPVILAVRVRGAAPASFADRLRELTVAVDPMLRLAGVNALDDTLRESGAMDRLIFIAVALLTLSVLLLSAAGIYALMSFTITRRRREIGIRAALGAGPRRVLWSVLSRAMIQIGLGIVIGITPWMVGLTLQALSAQAISWRGALSLLGVAALMALVGLAAAAGPARQALAIQPTEALRADG